MVIKGVPARLAKDAWWLDDAPIRRVPAIWLLAASVVSADLLLWSFGPGLGLVASVICVAAAIHLSVWPEVGMDRALRAWALLGLALLPGVELVQALSIGFAILGLVAFAVLMVVPTVPEILRPMLRFPGTAIRQGLADGRNIRIPRPGPGLSRRLLLDWGLPLMGAAVFLGLVTLANPVIADWLGRAGSGWSFDAARVTFWLTLAMLVWPFLRMTQMAPRLTKATGPRRLWRLGAVNGRSVLRALVVFNLIFAVQAVLDAGYLWAGMALPDGMTYAEYAHRGAYPLLVAALMAGLFALIAQPFLGAERMLRGLLYLWIAQTILLVLSSIMRLDLYIDAYGLTRMRFAALIWMGVVALGLVLLMVQMMIRQRVSWFGLRAGGLGLLVLYAVAFINVDGIVARYNLEHGHEDPWYMCRLSEGATPALRAYGKRCGGIRTPEDWREWGFRNARLRRSLADMNEVQE